MSTFSVFYNKKKGIKEPAEKIIKQLKEKGYNITSPNHPESAFLLTLGGDGTVLNAVDRAINHNLPILSVCLGKIGFLSELSPKDIFWGIEKALQGKYKIDSRKMICASIFRNHKKIKEGMGLNDAVVSSSRIARIVDIETYINSKKTALYRADGVIVATATGSTAYNLSAGGTILPPSRKELIITPICPHQINWKSQLISPQKKITLKIHFPKKQAMLLTLDGQKHFPLRSEDEIKITCQQKKVDFIRFKPYNFKKLLKEKLSFTSKS
ncbi:MAG: NAD(+)/NADH kinase [Candidatus Margulisbacteria bacterium]|nr:NAD(+)/NADH kinase [Candidatus Margulisiibacteriota bacterium]